MSDTLRPRTALDRGPAGEERIRLDPRYPEVLEEAGGDSAALDLDANVGGAPASAGLDSGGAVGVRRGAIVGRPGAEFDDSPGGEAPVEDPLPATSEEVALPGPRRDRPEARWGGK